MLKFGAGWVPGSVANVFVANHDTERVSPTILKVWRPLPG